MKRGFTLIELLIVVIIVGILATVALPQYTKVVQKARGAEAVSMLGSLRTAQMLYYVEKSKFTTGRTDLVVEYPTSGNWAYSYSNNGDADNLESYVYAVAKMDDMYITLKIEDNGSTTWGPPGPDVLDADDKHPGTPSN